MLKQKTVVVGVAGGIAAYKSASIVSSLKKTGADVWVVMTPPAAQLVAPLTFRTLSGNPVILDLFNHEEINSPVPHVSLADRADLIVIAPCTANIIGKIANGIADDALTTIVMASKAKKLLAPAMNRNMWQNLVVKENVEKLAGLGFDFIGPVEGRLACGADGIGKMAQPKEIYERIVELIGARQDLKGKKILVTAGGTREPIDPIRFISNRSSGKMGYALAQAAKQRGAQVILVSAPTNLVPPAGVELVEVISSKEMHTAVNEHKGGCNILIMAAAVADYRPSIYFFQKLKKAEENYQLELSRTIDILTELGKSKNGTFLVGFAAETDDLLENAREKLRTKNLDLIVANDSSVFDGDNTVVTIIDREGTSEELPELSKEAAAHKIIDSIISRLP